MRILGNLHYQTFGAENLKDMSSSCFYTNSLSQGVREGTEPSYAVP